jgi:glycosyltransferase involved in cell wall biosynthesis
VEVIDAAPRSEVPNLIRQATAVVQVSESENFGSSVAEALACGVPVVVGQTNGTADYVDDQSCVFRDYSADAVANAMRIVIDRQRHDPDAVRRSARSAAELRFGAPQIVTRLMELLASVANNGPPTTRRATPR